jgi:hypothetical protein
MKAYGNLFQVNNNENDLLVTHDCGVAYIFQQPKGMKMMFSK